MELKTIPIEKPEDLNFILGQSHFIKTVEDLHEVLVATVPGIRFGLAFCEASGPCLVRVSGNDAKLIAVAKSNALNIGAGHSFIVFIENAYPVNVLRLISAVPEVVNIFCATANPVEVIVAESKQGRGILGVIDGAGPRGVESEEDAQDRKALLRRFGYKL